MTDTASPRVVELLAERDAARKIVRDIYWMARRYADGRRSYAVGMFNDAVRPAYDAGWLEHKLTNEPAFARDGDFDAEYRTMEQRALDAEARLSASATVSVAPEGVPTIDVMVNAMHVALQDERDGQPCGSILEKGCEVAGYSDPESAADSFLVAAAEAARSALATTPAPAHTDGEGMVSVGRFIPLPLRFHEAVGNGAAYIRDAEGGSVAMLMWPGHAPEDEDAAVAELYALGRAMAAAYTPSHTDTVQPSEAGEVERLREALDDLQKREAEYRYAHDHYGDDDLRAGHAWDKMRRAGDRARAALTKEPRDER